MNVVCYEQVYFERTSCLTRYLFAPLAEVMLIPNHMLKCRVCFEHDVNDIWVDLQVCY